MANNRHRDEKIQTYRALALMWFLIVTMCMRKYTGNIAGNTQGT